MSNMFKPNDILPISYTETYHKGIQATIKNSHIPKTEPQPTFSTFPTPHFHTHPHNESFCFYLLVAVKPGVRFREIGEVVSRHASKASFSVVKSYCGHGIGELFHCAPNIPHYASE